MSYCETIRGEVSIRKMYAGGLSYFSSGSVGGSLREGAWAEAVVSPDSKTKQMEKRVLDTIKGLKLKKGDRISEHARGVHQIFSTQTGYGVPVNSQRPSESTVSRTANYANNADKGNRSTMKQRTRVPEIDNDARDLSRIEK